MKNMPDFRLIEVNNLGIVEYYLERLDEAVNLSIQQMVKNIYLQLF